MPSHKKIYVAVTNDLATDQRVQKVCDFLKEHQYDVHLIGRKLPDSLNVEHLPFKTTRFSMIFKSGPLFYAFYNIRLFFFLLFRKTPYLLANDLDTLLACSFIKSIKGNMLFYDAHEYFTEVPEVVNRKNVQNIWKKIERFGIRRVDRMYTVNKSIAELYEKNYSKNADVVRNITSPERLPKHHISRKDIGLKETDFIGIIQGAGINIDRGAEEIVEAAAKIEGFQLLIVGSGDVIPELKQKVEDKGWDNICFFGKQPYEKLMQISQLADVGFTMDKDTNINYRYSLPNKLFDFIHSGIPVIASNLPEVTKVVKGHNVGLITSHNISDIQSSIIKLKTERSLMEELKANCILASSILNWENEIEVLKKIYP